MVSYLATDIEIQKQAAGFFLQASNFHLRQKLFLRFQKWVCCRVLAMHKSWGLRLKTYCTRKGGSSVSLRSGSIGGPVIRGRQVLDDFTTC